MKASGVDMTVYKEYATPVEKEELTVKPIMAKLGPVYKGDAGKVAAALAKVPAQEVADAMAKKTAATWQETIRFSPNKSILANRKPSSAAHALYRMWWSPVLAQTGSSTWR